MLIASITSCTNTSNPALLIAAGLVAKRAVEKGLKPHPRIKTSLAPGSRVVTAYLRDAGLLPHLEKLGFGVVAYGCTTCMGASGPLDARIEETVVSKDLVTCAVLSGNRNFEARVHANVRANYLASPPLVVAYALAGTVRTDLSKDPLGTGSDGQPVYLRDLWPTTEEVASLLGFASTPNTSAREFGDLQGTRSCGTDIPTIEGAVYKWDDEIHLLRSPRSHGGTRTPGVVRHRRRACSGDPRTRSRRPHHPLEHHQSGNPGWKMSQQLRREPRNGGTSEYWNCNHSSWCAAPSPMCADDNGRPRRAPKGHHEWSSRPASNDDFEASEITASRNTRRSSSGPRGLRHGASLETGRQKVRAAPRRQGGGFVKTSSASPR